MGARAAWLDRRRDLRNPAGVGDRQRVDLAGAGRRPDPGRVLFGWANRGARWWMAAIVGPLLALAWLSPSTLWGQGAATLLTAFSCVTLGVLLASVCPPRWLKIGIILMAAGDSYLVSHRHPAGAQRRSGGRRSRAGAASAPGDHVRRHPARLRRRVRRRSARWRCSPARAAAASCRSGWGCSRCFSPGSSICCSLRSHELPATVPVALAVIVSEGWRLWRRRRSRAEDRRRQWGSSPVEAGGLDSSASEVMASVPRAASSSTSVASSAERE